MAIKSLAQTLKDLATGIKNTITGITGSNATLTITKGNGTTSTVTVNNVANATKATQDSAGQQINTTYIKSLSVSGKTVTYTKGNGTTGTITTQDTVYTHPNSGVTAGTYRSVTVNAQGHVTGGSNPTTLSGYGITDAPTKTGGGASGTWGINVSGNSATATKATQDSAGQQINTTYLKGLSISGKTITYTKGNGTTGTITLPLQLTDAELHGNVIESIVLENNGGSGHNSGVTIYSDGWMSQSGSVSTTPSDSFQTINLVKPFSNTDYQTSVNYIVSGTNQIRTIYGIGVTNKTTTSFQVSRNQSNLKTIMWFASGK